MYWRAVFYSFLCSSYSKYHRTCEKYQSKDGSKQERSSRTYVVMQNCILDCQGMQGGNRYGKRSSLYYDLQLRDTWNGMQWQGGSHSTNYGMKDHSDTTKIQMAKLYKILFHILSLIDSRVRLQMTNGKIV